MCSEKALIEGCKKGERKAQRELYDLYAGRMMAISARYSKSDLEAEDILQESFIKVFDKIQEFKGESKIYHWIKRVVVNTALNYGRKKLYMFPMVDVYNMNESCDEDLSLSDYNFRELLIMIQALPSGCQIIFNLYAIEGYSHQEIADELGISVGTSKSQYSRGRALLREMILNEERISYGQAK